MRQTDLLAQMRLTQTYTEALSDSGSVSGSPVGRMTELSEAAEEKSEWGVRRGGTGES